MPAAGLEHLGRHLVHERCVRQHAEYLRRCVRFAHAHPLNDLDFGGQADLVITGAATGIAALGDCPNFVITAQEAWVTGTLHAALMPTAIPTGVEYTMSNLTVSYDLALVSVSGCEPSIASVLTHLVGASGSNRSSKRWRVI